MLSSETPILTVLALVYSANDVVGKVCINYTDGVMGKIKERIEGKNHVFMDRLNPSSIGTFFLMDDNTSPDDKFQYLRGDIIDWRRAGNEASGSYRGKYLASDSILDGDIDIGNRHADKTQKVSYKSKRDYYTAWLRCSSRS
jgi:hypothetical protein